MEKIKEKLPSDPKLKIASKKNLKPLDLKKLTDNLNVQKNKSKFRNKKLTKNNDLLTINNIILKISEESNFNSILEYIMDEALNVVGLEGGTICLINPDNTLKAVVNRETSKETLNDLLIHNIKIGDCLCGNCAKDCKPLILNNRKEVIKYSSREVLRGEDIRFHAAFPFLAKGKCFGVLCIFTRTDVKPSSRSLKLLEKIVAQTAILVENTALYEKIKENEKRLRLSTELAKVAVWEYDLAANEMTRSDNYDRLYGLEWQSKWNINTFLNATHPDDRDYSNDIIKKSAVAGGENQYKFDFRVIYPDQSIHWLSVIGEVFERNSKGEGALVHGTLIDITDRKKIEEEIKNLSQELEFRVIQRTAQLQEVNKELESFVYSVSHDLRAPLRSIMGFSEIISKRYKDSLYGESLEYFGYILEASRNMSNLIDDLLKFSRLTKGTIGKESIDLNEIMKTVLKNLNQDIVDNNAKIEFPNKFPIIKSESFLIGQMLTNLINNAIIYHRKGINPEVQVSIYENDENVVIKVIDNGQGIPKEYHKKIFNIFQRLHSNDEYPGTGIGLAIVKKAAAALGGKVTLKSEVGKGSMFSVLLPRK